MLRVIPLSGQLQACPADLFGPYDGPCGSVMGRCSKRATTWGGSTKAFSGCRRQKTVLFVGPWSLSQDLSETKSSKASSSARRRRAEAYR